MPILKVYPSGDFTLGLTSQPPARSDKPQTALQITKHEIWKTYHWAALYEVEIDKKIANEALVKVDRKRQAQRGLKGLSPNGKRFVKSGCKLLQDRFGQQNLAFLTVTIPSVTSEELHQINLNWSEICRRFYQELQRELCRHGLPKNYVGVTEIQESRYHKYGEVAPHLHIVFQGRKVRCRNWAISKDAVKNLWQRILNPYCPSVVDFSASTRIEQVKYNAANYLSKYFSKGGKILTEIFDKFGKSYIPTNWYSIPNTYKREIASLIIRDNGEFAQRFFKNLFNGNYTDKVWFRQIWIDLPDENGRSHELIIGIVGTINDSQLLKQITARTGRITE